MRGDDDGELTPCYSESGAKMHDGQALVGLVNETDNVLFADST